MQAACIHYLTDQLLIQPLFLAKSVFEENTLAALSFNPKESQECNRRRKVTRCQLEQSIGITIH